MTWRGVALETLRGLTFRVRRGMGDRPGDRRFPGRPQPAGIELEGHSAYVPGDDLRHLDWNALGRLDALVVRRFSAEREVVVNLLVDCSASMAVPPRDGKLSVATDLAMALAWIALAANDAVRVTLFPGDGPPRVSPVFRQRPSALRVRALLEAAAASGRLALGTALEHWVLRHPRPGVAVVVSDLMMDPADLARALVALRTRRYEVVVLHVIGRGELEPEREFSRGLLTDVETGATHPVVLTSEVLERYREALDAHMRALQAVAERTQSVYARLPTDADVRDFVAVELPRLGVIKRR